MHVDYSDSTKRHNYPSEWNEKQNDAVVIVV